MLIFLRFINLLIYIILLILILERFHKGTKREQDLAFFYAISFIIVSLITIKMDSATRNFISIIINMLIITIDIILHKVHKGENEPLILGESGSGKVRCAVIPNTENFNDSISEDKEQ